MDRNQPWFILVVLAFVGIIIVIVSYYINLYSNPDKYIKRYLIVKAAAKSKYEFENDKFNFFGKANITVKTDNEELPGLECTKNNRLIECSDDFNHFYTVNGDGLIMNNYIYHRDTYDLNWNTSNQYDMYGLYPNILIFDQVLDNLANNTINGKISEQDLFNTIYRLYGTGDRIGKNNNYYSVKINRDDNLNKIVIVPKSDNQDSIYPYLVEVNYQVTSDKIELNRNMFK